MKPTIAEYVDLWKRVQGQDGQGKFTPGEPDPFWGERHIVVSYSELAAWRDCDLKHWLSYRQRQPDQSSFPGTKRGTEWHRIMEQWFNGRKARVSRDVLIDQIVADHFNLNACGSDEERDRQAACRWMFDGFLQQEKALWRGHRILEVEQEAMFPLGYVMIDTGERVHIWLKTICDLLTVYDGLLWVVDHKSASKVSKQEKDMAFDDQSGLYLASQGFLRHLKVGGGIWNYAISTQLKTRERTMDERFWQVMHRRSPKEPLRILAEALSDAVDMYSDPLDYEPTRSPHPERCRWCSHRSECLYARKDDRPVRLVKPVRADWRPEGMNAVEIFPSWVTA